MPTVARFARARTLLGRGETTTTLDVYCSLLYRPAENCSDLVVFWVCASSGHCFTLILPSAFEKRVSLGSLVMATTIFCRYYIGSRVQEEIPLDNPAPQSEHFFCLSHVRRHGLANVYVTLRCAPSYYSGPLAYTLSHARSSILFDGAGAWRAKFWQCMIVC